MYLRMHACTHAHTHTVAELYEGHVCAFPPPHLHHRGCIVPKPGADFYLFFRSFFQCVFCAGWEPFRYATRR